MKWHADYIREIRAHEGQSTRLADGPRISLRDFMQHLVNSLLHLRPLQS